MRAEKVAESRPVASLLEALKRVPDRRTPEGRQHPLPAVLALVTVATICGCQGQRAIGAWGRLQSRKVRRALGFRKVKTPAHSTIHEVLKKLDVGAYEEVLREWASGLGATEKGELRAIAIDGKTLRGTVGKVTPGVHVLSAFDIGNGVVVASTALEGRGGELQAAHTLVAAMSLEGAVLTGDAAFAQRDLCRAVVEGGGHYMFTVKDNQPTLRQAIELAFDPPSSPL